MTWETVEREELKARVGELETEVAVERGTRKVADEYLAKERLRVKELEAENKEAVREVRRLVQVKVDLQDERDRANVETRLAHEAMNRADDRLAAVLDERDRLQNRVSGLSERVDLEAALTDRLVKQAETDMLVARKIADERDRLREGAHRSVTAHNGTINELRKVKDERDRLRKAGRAYMSMMDDPSTTAYDGAIKDAFRQALEGSGE